MGEGATRPFDGLLPLRAVAACIALVVLSRSRADPDLWGHLRFGLDVLAGGLPKGDPYSFTSDVPWVNHEWLAEVVMALAWRAGPAGLAMLRIGLVGLSLVLVGAALRRGMPAPARHDLTIAVALFTMAPLGATVRPQLFSLPLFAAVGWIASSSRPARRLRLLALAPLFALWANLHGGWIVGLGTVCAVLGVEAVAERTGWRDRATVLGVVVAAVLATLANPYGIQLWAFLGSTVRMAREDITEWQPAFTAGLDIGLVWVVAAAFAAMAALRGPRARLADTLPVAGLAIGALRVARLLGFFGLAAAILLRPRAQVSRGVAGPRVGAPAAVGLWAGAAAAAVAATWLAMGNVRCLAIDPSWAPEADAFVFLSARHPQRLVVWFDWGEWAIWQLPGTRVSYDGRRETVYSQEVRDRHMDLYGGGAAGVEWLEGLDADAIWLPRDIPVVPVLEERGWHAAYRGPVSVVLARGEGAVLTGCEEQGRRCFPGEGGGGSECGR